MVVNIGKNQFKSFLLHKVSILAFSHRCAMPAPKVGALAVHVNFISLPKALLLGEVCHRRVRGRAR